MSTKWLNKLTKEELIELHEYVFGKGLVNDLEVWHDDDNFDSEFISITVKENGWEGDNGKDETIDTDYELEDFDGYTIIDWAGTGNNNYKIDFRMWMINRFGTEYVDELVKETLGLNLINYLDWSKTREE